jgi:HK97 family phage prohead protease
MEKTFAIESVETLGEAGSGKFEALVSVFGNVDAVKDVVMPGAFARAIKESDPPPVVWSHHWQIPPIGETVDWSESGKGLQIKGELFVGDDDKHQYADMVYAAMKSREGRKPALREFSFSYDIPNEGAKRGERDVGGKTVGVQEIYEFFPVFESGPTLKGCNPATEMLNAPKHLHELYLEREFTLEDRELLREIGELEASKTLKLREYVKQLKRSDYVDEEKALHALRREMNLLFPDH